MRRLTCRFATALVLVMLALGCNKIAQASDTTRLIIVVYDKTANTEEQNLVRRQIEDTRSRLFRDNNGLPPFRIFAFDLAEANNPISDWPKAEEDPRLPRKGEALLIPFLNKKLASLRNEIQQRLLLPGVSKDEVFFHVFDLTWGEPDTPFYLDRLGKGSYVGGELPVRDGRLPMLDAVLTMWASGKFSDGQFDNRDKVFIERLTSDERISTTTDRVLIVFYDSTEVSQDLLAKASSVAQSLDAVHREMVFKWDYSDPPKQHVQSIFTVPKRRLSLMSLELQTKKWQFKAPSEYKNKGFPAGSLVVLVFNVTWDQYRGLLSKDGVEYLTGFYFAPSQQGDLKDAFEQMLKGKIVNGDLVRKQQSPTEPPAPPSAIGWKENAPQPKESSGFRSIVYNPNFQYCFTILGVLGIGVCFLGLLLAPAKAKVVCLLVIVVVLGFATYMDPRSATEFFVGLGAGIVFLVIALCIVGASIGTFVALFLRR